MVVSLVILLHSHEGPPKVVPPPAPPPYEWVLLMEGMRIGLVSVERAPPRNREYDEEADTIVEIYGYLDAGGNWVENLAIEPTVVREAFFRSARTPELYDKGPTEHRAYEFRSERLIECSTDSRPFLPVPGTRVMTLKDYNPKAESFHTSPIGTLNLFVLDERKSISGALRIYNLPGILVRKPVTAKLERITP
jgi:hypothetical protein